MSRDIILFLCRREYKGKDGHDEDLDPFCPFSVATNTVEGFASEQGEGSSLLSRRFSSNYLVGSHPLLQSIRCPSSASSGGGVSNEVVIESAFFTTGSVFGKELGSKRLPCPERL